MAVERYLIETSGTDGYQKEDGSGALLLQSSSVSIPAAVDDTVALTESTTKSVGKGLAETLGLSELFSTVKTVFRTVGDSVALTESFARQVNKTLGETVVLTEALLLTVNRTIADTVSLTENLVTRRVKALGETLGVTELLTKFLSRQQAETVVLTEQFDAEVIQAGGGWTPGIGPWNCWQQCTSITMPTYVFPRR